LSINLGFESGNEFGRTLSGEKEIAGGGDIASPTARLRTGLALNDLVEQDRRKIKRLVRSGLGLKNF